jgi:hypothetical protein
LIFIRNVRADVPSFRTEEEVAPQVELETA